MKAVEPRHASEAHVEKEIPWYVNGTASPAERDRVEQHVAACESCDRALALETRLAALVRDQHETLEWAPQSGWHRLVKRLEAMPAVERADTTATGSVLSSAPSGQTPSRGAIRRIAIPAVLLAQAAAIAALAIALSQLSADRQEAAYRTLTQPESGVASSVPVLRVVFAAEATNARIRQLLEQAGGGTIRSGPSAAGVYTIELTASGEGTPVAERAAEWLRAQPDVLFAEPVGQAMSADPGAP